METKYQLPILPEFSSQQVESACCFHLLLLLGHFFRLAGYPLRSDVIYSSLWTKRWEGERGGGGGGGVEGEGELPMRPKNNEEYNPRIMSGPLDIPLGRYPLLLDEVQEICRTSKSSDIYELCRADKRFIWFFSNLPPFVFCSTPLLYHLIFHHIFFSLWVVIQKEIKISLE